MRTLVTILSLMSLSSTVFAGDCNEIRARNVAAKYFKNSPQVFLTVAEETTYKVDGIVVTGNLRVKFVKAVSANHVEIGELEMDSGTCQVVKQNSQSAQSANTKFSEQ